MKEEGYIEIKGARVNNLKNISVKIPRNKLVAIAGVSGSGKSSLAFDTLYAEGQRRYVESLSAYARQFLGRMQKPECDYIKGLPPAIAIEQKVIARNPRSTVGTSTEIYEYMRLLFARAGHIFSPVSGIEVKRHTAEDVVQCMLDHPDGIRFAVFAPMPDGTEQRIDRLKVDHSQSKMSRLTDSVETAFNESGGYCKLVFYNDDGTEEVKEFSTRLEADGMKFEDLSDNLFAFNSSLGVCPTCEGFGNIIGIDENLVIPDTSLSVYDGCVAPWKGEKMGEWKRYFIRRASIDNFPIFTPYCELSQQHKDWLWHGLPCDRDADKYEVSSIDNFFRMVRENQYKIQYRVMLARYRGKTVCPECHGKRLRKEAEYVKVAGKTITELVEMPVSELAEWFNNIQLSELDKNVSARLLTEITSRLQFLLDVGLGYLTLNRPSNTLSGGESQRINLCTSLGSALVGSLYILDEPSIGMHSRDTARLIKVLKQLRDIGNTVVVVEHDEDILRAADEIIEIGPDAGRLGGEVVEIITPNSPVLNNSLPDGKGVRKGHTAAYLDGTETIQVPESRRAWNRTITIKNADLNNLKNLTVEIPLNVMTCITGVSGSGKSSLVKCLIKQISSTTSSHSKKEGDGNRELRLECVDQNPIGKSTRSNPATYMKAWDYIRQLFSEQQLAKQMNITPAHFSFNAEGGRCEECKGAGVVTVEMQFMADLILPCEACHGKRFKRDILEITYRDKNIDDVLNMTVDEAINFFSDSMEKAEKKSEQRLLDAIISRLLPLAEVGLGYIQLGQSSSTLSGGENQRVKLAYYIGMDSPSASSAERSGGEGSILFIFDEPTTGLHFHDIKKLLHAFDELIKRGNTVLIIEHNMEVIKCADHIIDLGPEGGKEGGNIVCQGTPEEIALCADSYTGRFLQSKL